MRIYKVSSDPAIGAQDIRITGDEVAIVLSKEEARRLCDILYSVIPLSEKQDRLTTTLYGKIKEAM